MIRLTTTFERTVIATAAVALSTLTLLAATVAPASADQSALAATLNASAPTVLVVGETATRVN
jgi:hypothetical protein